MIFENFIQKIGNTPLVKFGNYKNAVIWLKLEGENPTGSVKDRPAYHIIKKIHKTNNGDAKKIILDASSGSFGCAIAYYGKLFGYKVTVITSSKLTRSNEKFLRYYDAEIIKHGEITKDGYEYCKKIMISQSDKYHFLDQLNNWDNPESHYLTTGPEIFQALPDVSAVVASIGSGATFYGIAKYFKENSIETKFIAAIAKPGIKIAGTFLKNADYITPFINKINDDGWIDLKIPSSFEEARENVKILSEKGFFCGIQTGGVFRAAKKAIDELNLDGNVVVVSGDTGWKNFEKIM